MATKRPPKVPAHPITDEERAEFRRLLDLWRDRLHLKDWRVAIGRARPAGALATVECLPEHRLARVCVGRDWGAVPPGPHAIEDTVVHELLHIRLRELASLALSEETVDERVVDGVEHAAIVPLAEAFVGLSVEIEKLRAEIASLKKAAV